MLFFDRFSPIPGDRKFSNTTLILSFIFLLNINVGYAQEKEISTELKEAFPKILPTEMKQISDISEPGDGTGYLYTNEKNQLSLKVYALEKEESAQARQQMYDAVKAGTMEKRSYDEYETFEQETVVRQSPSEGKLKGYKVYVPGDNFILQALGDVELKEIYRGLQGLQLDEISAIIKRMK
ncbi:MAG TPA: hypothetical protein VJ899_08880 [Salegentibacter sp.]|nr:hypothetical protein [Salegentibacter sp.]